MKVDLKRNASAILIENCFDRIIFFILKNIYSVPFYTKAHTVIPTAVACLKPRKAKHFISNSIFSDTYFRQRRYCGRY